MLIVSFGKINDISFGYVVSFISTVKEFKVAHFSRLLRDTSGRQETT